MKKYVKKFGLEGDILGIWRLVCLVEWTNEEGKWGMGVERGDILTYRSVVGKDDEVNSGVGKEHRPL